MHGLHRLNGGGAWQLSSTKMSKMPNVASLKWSAKWTAHYAMVSSCNRNS